VITSDQNYLAPGSGMLTWFFYYEGKLIASAETSSGRTSAFLGTRSTGSGWLPSADPDPDQYAHAAVAAPVDTPQPQSAW
jgi:hypothetical protein